MRARSSRDRGSGIGMRGKKSRLLGNRSNLVWSNRRSSPRRVGNGTVGAHRLAVSAARIASVGMVGCQSTSAVEVLSDQSLHVRQGQTRTWLRGCVGCTPPVIDHHHAADGPEVLAPCRDAAAGAMEDEAPGKAFAEEGHQLLDRDARAGEAKGLGRAGGMGSTRSGQITPRSPGST